MHKSNIINSDYYKVSHGPMYNPKVSNIFSYAESRGGEYDTSILFGLQHYLIEDLSKPVTKYDIDEAADTIGSMGGKYNRQPWDDLLNKHGGNMPVKIKAVPEGLKVPVKNALVTVRATDDEFKWTVPYIETALIRLWYPTTIASKAYAMRKKIDKQYAKFADKTASADFALIDFGCRGVESYEAAALGAAAFLTSFRGTDTIPGVQLLKDNYGATSSGFSVKASEHSVMCSWGESHEKESFIHILENVAEDNDTISVVSDTWNIYNACKMWIECLPIIRRKNLTLVIRPDSGNPMEVLPKMLEILKPNFPMYVNDKGLAVFKDIKLLWGDGVDESNYIKIMKLFPKLGFGVENLILGSGGGLLQNVNRDTMKFAFKASAVKIKEAWVPINKSPITDPGKVSKKGKLETIRSKEDGLIRTVDWTIGSQLGTKLLEPVFENGKVLRNQTLEEIRTLVTE